MVCISVIDENESCRKLQRCISVFFQRLDSQESEMHLRILSVCIFLLFLLAGLLVVIVWHLSDLLTSIMVDRDDRLRHDKIAQQAFILREKSQVSRAPVPFSSVDVETSIYGVHISPPSSSCRRQVSPSDTSLPSSSRRWQVSPTQTAEVPKSPEVP